MPKAGMPKAAIALLNGSRTSENTTRKEFPRTAHSPGPIGPGAAWVLDWGYADFRERPTGEVPRTILLGGWVNNPP